MTIDGKIKDEKHFDLSLTGELQKCHNYHLEKLI